MRTLMLLLLTCLLIGCSGESLSGNARKEGFECGKSGVIDTLACPYRPNHVGAYNAWKEGWIEGRKEFVANNKGKQ